MECPIFKRLTPKVLPVNARALLRIVTRCEQQKYNEQDLAIFLNLEDHTQEIQDQRDQSQADRISLSAKAVKEYSSTSLKEESVALLGAKLELNAFDLTNALYDRVGLYLHPYAALMNHSCDYNCIVGFDGDELFVKAIRPIDKGEQIFISYVDATNPYEVRQEELSTRYFFHCRCVKCEREKTDAPVQDSLAARASILTAKAADHGDDDIKHITDEMQLVLQRIPAHDIIRYPYVSLRDELVNLLLAAEYFRKAFIHAAIRYVYIDPTVYPREGHPIRQVHAWALAKLTVHLSQGAGEKKTGDDDDCLLEDSQMDLNIILWSVLHRLWANQSESLTVPTFKLLVRKAFEQVHGAFAANGICPNGLRGQVDREWGKLREMLSIELDKRG